MKRKVLIGISLAVMGIFTVFWSNAAKAELSLADENAIMLREEAVRIPCEMCTPCICEFNVATADGGVGVTRIKGLKNVEKDKEETISEGVGR